MAFRILEDCIYCGECEGVCPNRAIAGDRARGIFVVDASRCTECKGFYDTQQCARVCPQDVCVPDPDRPK